MAYTKRGITVRIWKDGVRLFFFNRIFLGTLLKHPKYVETQLRESYTIEQFYKN